MEMGTTKTFMYHYVQPDNSNCRKHFVSLSKFEKELDQLEQRFGVYKIGEWPNLDESMNSKKCLLTFDDGLSDHFDFVFPLLVRKGFLGLFFVPTYQLKTQQMLNVHAIHKLEAEITEEELVNCIDSNLLRKMTSNKADQIYSKYDSTDAFTKLKSILHFSLDYEFSREIIGQIFTQIYGTHQDSFMESWYFNQTQLNEMINSGMELGNHTSRHQPLDLISDVELRYEIETSQGYFETNVGFRPKLISYPFGRVPKLNTKTRKIMRDSGLSTGFTAHPFSEAKGGGVDPLLIPRHDCNEIHKILS